MAEYATPCVPPDSEVVLMVNAGVLMTNESDFVIDTAGVAESVNVMTTG